jgi:hypothetical protein
MVNYGLSLLLEYGVCKGLVSAARRHEIRPS